MQRLRRQVLRQGVAEHLLGASSDEVADVFRHAGDEPIGRDCDEKSDRLNQAQSMYGLTIAVRQVDQIVGSSLH